MNSKRLSLLYFFLVGLCFQVFSQQKQIQSLVIELRGDVFTVRELIAQVEAQTIVRFSYDEKLLQKEHKIHIEIGKKRLGELLDLINTKLLISASIKGNLIILTRQTKRVGVYGKVKDGSDGEFIIGATVWDQKSRQGSITNNYGFYHFDVTSGDTVNLIISHVGYEPVSMQLLVLFDTLVDVALKIRELEEVVILSQSYYTPVQDRTQMSSINIPMQQIDAMPALLGESDIIKSLQMLPGVQSGTEGSSGMYVRGGSPDQNLILLDGVPVYNDSHLFGFFSVFNEDAISNLELIKGGFPARYGGRLSSVLDISMKEGNRDHLTGSGSLGLISSKMTVEGPINSKSSFIVSGRRTYADLITEMLRKKSQDETRYYFHDFNGKINYRLSDKDQLFFSFYSGRDVFYSSTSTDVEYKDQRYSNTSLGEINWGNRLYVLRWNKLITPRLFSNLTLYKSDFEFNSNSESSDYNFQSDLATEYVSFNKYTSDIADLGGKFDIEWDVNNRYEIYAGTNLISHAFNPGVTSVQSSEAIYPIVNSEAVSAVEFQAYAENHIDITSRLKTNVGVHFSTFSVRNSLYKSVQPRISARYMINDKLAAKLSYSEMSQYIHLLTNSGIGLPTDLWVPSTDQILPQFSRQLAVGFAREFKGGIEITLEGYHKDMDGLIEYEEGANFLNPIENWEDKVEIGNGKSVGMEIFVQKKEGELSGWIGYTFANTTRTFENISNGAAFPFKYDIRHDLSLTSVYKVSPTLTISGNFIFRTGVATTLPVATYLIDPDDNPTMIEYYGSRNSSRLPSYHRMDLSAAWKKDKKWGERSWVVSIYNVYNRKNPFFIGRNVDENNQNQYYKLALFTFLPSVTYQFRFL